VLRSIGDENIGDENIGAENVGAEKCMTGCGKL
jgi:hypothetical protein